MTSYFSSSLRMGSSTVATMLSPSTNSAKTSTPTKSTGMSPATSSTSNSFNKYPHTRAQLTYIARQYKPSAYTSSGYDNCDNGDADNLTSNEAEVNGNKQGVSQAMVKDVVSLLGEEKDEELKTLLKENYGMDDESAEQNVLDLMHKHRDDVAGVPFLYLTPTIVRRPLSRPSSRASTNSATKFRSETPNNSSSAPSSPLIHQVLHMQRRPHTPAMASPLAPPLSSQGSSLSTKSDYSPSSSPVLPSTNPTSTPIVTTQAQWTASLPASPISSPRLLSAKASEFRPIPRPLSAAATHPHTHSTSFLLSRNETPPPDLWAHSSSPRAPSNLAIAAPLVADHSPATRPSTPALVPTNKTEQEGEGDNEGLNTVDGIGEEDEDPFDPFNPANVNAIPSFVADFDNTYDASMTSGLWTRSYPNHYPYAPGRGPSYTVPDISTLPTNGGQPPQILSQPLPDPSIDSEESSMLTDGMTPFDVLTSVFGSTLAPSELEEALKVNGYDFDTAMSWLVDGYAGGGQGLPSANQQGQGPANQGQQVNNGRLQQMGARVSVVSRDAMGAMRGAANGRGGYSAGPVPPNLRAPRYLNGRPVPSGNRVCRYFVAGECLRADCRFSHDLERALCRFWLRGTCAKQESCEFLHHLPKDVDVNALHALLSRNNYNMGPLAGVGHAMGANANAQGTTATNEEFPALGYDPNQGGPAAGRTRKFGAYDPSRTRFANAVKKPAPPSVPGQNQQGGGTEEAASSTLTIIAPKPSPRLKLHPPTLLPTLPTGEAVNKLYLSYRTRALQLGAQRNSCLSRAADAWRRGDGAGAKRWSREGEEMNRRMREEMAVAAGDLVRERARVVEGVVREGGAGSQAGDPSDRAVRGKVMGGRLGVCLGIAGRGVGGTPEQSAEERTEVMVDLHGLHANEATEVLESFLLALEQEHFLGLAYAIVGEEKHTGSGPVVTLGSQQDSTSATSSSTVTKVAPGASASSAAVGGTQNGSGNLNSPGRTGGATSRRLASGVKEWLHRWGYPWSERDGAICIDPLTHLSE